MDMPSDPEGFVADRIYTTTWELIHEMGEESNIREI